VYPYGKNRSFTPLQVLRFSLPMPKRILIAEDEASVRNAIRTFIEARSQFEVCEAIDGNEAIHKAQALKPDLVVLDLRMPVANGIEVAARLNISIPKTPTVIFTMFDDVIRKPLAKILGIAAVVPKSDGVASLLGRIEALLDAQDALAMQRH
jgi:DNA-binding NarL/FixJ family response regulator